MPKSEWRELRASLFVIQSHKTRVHLSVHELQKGSWEGKVWPLESEFSPLKSVTRHDAQRELIERAIRLVSVAMTFVEDL